MIYIESDSTDPYYNLALEEYVFEDLDKGEEFLILWQNANSIIVGKYQNTAEEVNQSFVDEHHIRVARRLSGGGAVYHDTGNLNYTLIVDQKNNPDFNFSLFVIPVIEALRELGVNAEFNGRNDLTIGGRKFSGQSQYAKGGRIMHHGCIMLDSNLENVQDALRVKAAKFESKSIKSVRSRVTTINEHAPSPISMETFKETLKRHVLSTNNGGTYKLTPEDIAQIERLARDKYSTWDWNYGRSPACSIRRDAHFEGGLICVQMNVEHGLVSDIHFSGDFFGNRDLMQLEQSLIGLPLDEHLKEKLSGLSVEEYIHGMSADLLADLLR